MHKAPIANCEEQNEIANFKKKVGKWKKHSMRLNPHGHFRGLKFLFDCWHCKFKRKVGNLSIGFCIGKAHPRNHLRIKIIKENFIKLSNRFRHLSERFVEQAAIFSSVSIFSSNSDFGT
jgi:hypothetical protein